MEKGSWNFGYPTFLECDICGEKPAQIEPRFGYVSCEKHSKLSPIDFQNRLIEIDKLKQNGK